NSAVFPEPGIQTIRPSCRSMSEPNEAIEVTAPSVDEAIRQALEKLGASEDDVIIQVLSTPRSGVLGLGVRQARVRVERRAPEGARSGVTSPPPAPQSRPRPPSEPAAGNATGGGGSRTRPAPQRSVVAQPSLERSHSNDLPKRSSERSSPERTFE